MAAKFSHGAKVKIKTRYFSTQIWSVDLKEYENMTGTIVDSKEVIAYIFQQIATSGEINASTIPMYSIAMEDGTVLHDIADYYLEESNP